MMENTANAMYMEEQTTEDEQIFREDNFEVYCFDRNPLQRMEDAVEEVYDTFGEEVGEYSEEVMEKFLGEDRELTEIKESSKGKNGYVVMEAKKEDIVYRRKIPVFKKWIYEGVKEKPWSFSRAGVVEEAYDTVRDEMVYSERRV